MSVIISSPSPKRAFTTLLLASLLTLGALLFSIRWSILPLAPGRSTSSHFLNFGSLPLSFEPNAGQADSSVLFMSHASGGILYFTEAGVTLSLASGAKAGTGKQAKAALPHQPAEAMEAFVHNMVRLRF